MNPAEAVSWLEGRARQRCDKPVMWSLDDVTASQTVATYVRHLEQLLAESREREDRLERMLYDDVA